MQCRVFPTSTNLVNPPITIFSTGGGHHVSGGPLRRFNTSRGWGSGRSHNRRQPRWCTHWQNRGWKARRCGLKGCKGGSHNLHLIIIAGGVPRGNNSYLGCWCPCSSKRSPNGWSQALLLSDGSLLVTIIESWPFLGKFSKFLYCNYLHSYRTNKLSWKHK